MPYKRALIVVALLLCACNQTPEAPPSLPDPALLDHSEESLRTQLGAGALQLLGAKDYDGLDKLASTYRALDTPFGSGMEPITCFYEGLTDNVQPETAGGYKQRESDIDAWVQARSDSVPAKIAHAMMLVSDAWFVRGHGYADTVKDDAWTIFGQKLNQAEEILDSVKDKRQDCPEWYAAQSSVGLGLSQDKATFLATALEGTTRFPKAVGIYAGVITFLAPRWYGTNKEVGDCVTQSADKVGGDEGDVLYARLARIVWIYSYDDKAITESGLSWPRIKHGMELISNRYPRSTHMANVFCVLAWLEQDRVTEHILFNHLGDRYEDAAWAAHEDYDKARAWAQ